MVFDYHYNLYDIIIITYTLKFQLKLIYNYDIFNNQKMTRLNELILNNLTKLVYR